MANSCPDCRIEDNAIVFCALHEAAQVMFDALEKVNSHISRQVNITPAYYHEIRPLWEIVGRAIAQAKGEKPLEVAW